MPISSFPKFPSEEFPVRINFTNKLPTGISLVSGGSTVRAINLDDDSDDAAVVLETGSLVLDAPNNLATITVKAGAAGERFRLEYQISTDGAGPVEEHLIMEIA